MEKLYTVFTDHEHDKVGIPEFCLYNCSGILFCHSSHNFVYEYLSYFYDKGSM